jgi:putative membrane protein insertion efficiency factor
MKSIKSIKLIWVSFLVIFFPFAIMVHASDFKAPWKKNDAQEVLDKNIDQKTNPLRFLVRAYRTHISPIDGKNCPMYPSCSTYSLQCFKRHGLFIGWILACDRLFRCGRDELRLSPQVFINGKFKCYDPLENNDFWWYHAP